MGKDKAAPEMKADDRGFSRAGSPSQTSQIVDQERRCTGEISFEGVAFDDTSVDHVPILLPTRPRPWTEEHEMSDEKLPQRKISAPGSDNYAAAASEETNRNI